MPCSARVLDICLTADRAHYTSAVPEHTLKTLARHQYGHVYRSADLLAELQIASGQDFFQLHTLAPGSQIALHEFFIVDNGL